MEETIDHMHTAHGPSGERWRRRYAHVHAIITVSDTRDATELDILLVLWPLHHMSKHGHEKLMPSRLLRFANKINGWTPYLLTSWESILSPAFVVPTSQSGRGQEQAKDLRFIAVPYK